MQWIGIPRVRCAGLGVAVRRVVQTEHRHSGLNFVTPQQRHAHEAPAIMDHRVAVCEQARARNPRRWSRGIRNWSLPASVWLNPVKEAKPEVAQGA